MDGLSEEGEREARGTSRAWWNLAGSERWGMEWIGR